MLLCYTQCQLEVLPLAEKAEYTFGVGPVGVEVGQRSLVADLLKRLGGLMVDLEDAARSPPPSAVVTIGHVEVNAAPARRFGSRVVGDGSLKQDWGRQLGGIDSEGRRA